jgi:hypothetical protein
MATVLRPPFWVPRQTDQPTQWSAEPINSSIIQILSSSGQVKQFHWNYTLDDPPTRQIYAELLNITILQTLSLVPFALRTPYTVFYFGQDNIWTPNLDMFSSRFNLLAGGVEPFEIDWVSPYTIDNPPVWSGEPVNSAIIQILSSTGQVKPFLWNYTLNDPPMWQGEPVNSATLQMLTVGGQVKPFRWNYTLDDAAPWNWMAENLNSGIQHAIVSVGQSPVYPLNLSIVLGSSYPGIIDFYPNLPLDNPVWSGSPLGFNQALNTPTAPRNPFINRQTYWYAEASTWSAEPINSATLQLLTVGGQVPPFRWNYTLQETPVWTWMSELLNSGIQHAITAGGQPPQFLPNFTLNELPMWQGSPYHAATISLLTFGGQPPTPRYVFPPGDASIWVGAPMFNTLSNLINAPPPPTVLGILNPQSLLMV